MKKRIVIVLIVIILILVSINFQTIFKVKHDLVDFNYDTSIVKGHVTLELLEKFAPYPLLAYTTVIAESGWPNKKSNLAKTINNNLGMQPSVTRCNSATLKDTMLIRLMLNLEYNRDYTMYTVNGRIIKNRCGDTLLAYNNRWAIFVTTTDCAKDIGEYQAQYISKKQASSPKKYLKRLIELNYHGGEPHYHDYWISIYKTLKSQQNGKN
jgi:hypothetical protein